MDKQIIINEKQKARDFLFLTKESQDYIIKQMKKEETCYPTFFMIIIKYLLLSLHVKPEEIKDIIFNYSLIFTSMFLYQNNIALNPFNYVLNNEVNNLETITNLKCDDKDNIYYTLLQNKKYIKDFLELENNIAMAQKLLFITDIEKQKNEIKAYNKVIRNIHSILVNNISYFTISNDIETVIKNKNKKQFDLMTANILHQDNDYIDFTFFVNSDNYRKLKENLITRNMGDNISLLAIIIDNIIKNNNLYYSKPITVKNKIYYQILSNASSKMKFESIDFIFLDVNRELTILNDQINEFQFTYNNKRYIMTKKFIKML